MDKERKQKRSNDDRVIRSYSQVAEQLRLRHGWKLSKDRVCQICVAAENKIREALTELMADEVLS